MEERRKRFFLDTYAMIELSQGNKRYEKYYNYEGVTSMLNLYELFYKMLRNHGEDVAQLIFKKFENITIPIKKDHLKEASRIKMRKTLSYVDALGYSIARSENILFLTGDNDFKGFPHVEFVK